MAISYPLSLPAARGIARITLRGTSVTSQSMSPFTLQEQIQVFPGQKWSATIDLPPMRREDAEQWNAFLLSLNGRQGTFLMGDPAGYYPQGVGGGFPEVDGSAQQGNVLNVKGCPTSTVNWLKAGDYLQLNSIANNRQRLHKVLQNVDTDSDGLASLVIWPNLRESPVDEDSLIIINARGEFRLQNSYTEWSIQPLPTYNQSIAVGEAL